MIVGTVAMLLVGGDLLVHNINIFHEYSIIFSELGVNNLIFNSFVSLIIFILNIINLF